MDLLKFLFNKSKQMVWKQKFLLRSGENFDNITVIVCLSIFRFWAFFVFPPKLTPPPLPSEMGEGGAAEPSPWGRSRCIFDSEHFVFPPKLTPPPSPALRNGGRKGLWAFSLRQIPFIFDCSIYFYCQYNFIFNLGARFKGKYKPLLAWAFGRWPCLGLWCPIQCFYQVKNNSCLYFQPNNYSNNQFIVSIILFLTWAPDSKVSINLCWNRI